MKYITLIVLGLIVLGMSPAGAQDTQMQLVVVRNDQTAGGFLDVQLQLKQNGLSPTTTPSNTLTGFTADVDYNAAHLTFQQGQSSALLNQGYTLGFNSLSGAPASGTGAAEYIRLTATGGSVGTDFGDQQGVTVETGFGTDFGTIRFQITAAGAAARTTDLFIRSGSVAASYFTNAQNSPQGTAQDASVTQTTSLDNVALPVELTRFEVVMDGDEATLVWETASETNNSGFDVETFFEARSAFAQASTTFANAYVPDDGEEDAAFTTRAQGTWEKEGFVQGAGTKLEAQDYQHALGALDPGVYRFRLRQIDYDGGHEYSPEVEVTVEVPRELTLRPNYPNPFNPSTVMTFTVPEAGRTQLVVYDVIGRQVARVFDGEATPGQYYRLQFDGSGLASGVYIYALKHAGQLRTGRMMLVK
ncbi:MAG: T9SS type A sorting domain-containing protein [Bacteroidota bacterium]